MNTLTDRILALLSSVPTASVDIWDALGDVTLTQSDVTSELRALCDEGRAVRAGEGRASRYSLATAVAVAS